MILYHLFTNYTLFNHTAVGGITRQEFIDYENIDVTRSLMLENADLKNA